MYKHLLVPIDGGEFSERAVHSSVALAHKLGARITAFVAEPYPELPHMGSHSSTFAREADAHAARTQAHAQEALERFKAHAASMQVPCDGRFVRTDTVDEAIVSAAQEAGCDLIVMVTHGRGAVGELLFGSHTRNVIARSSLALLVLH